MTNQTNKKTIGTILMRCAMEQPCDDVTQLMLVGFYSDARFRILEVPAQSLSEVPRQTFLETPLQALVERSREAFLEVPPQKSWELSRPVAIF